MPKHFKQVRSKSTNFGKLASAGNSLSELDGVIDELKAMDGMEATVEKAMETRAKLLEQQTAEESIQSAIKEDYDALMVAIKMQILAVYLQIR